MVNKLLLMKKRGLVPGAIAYWDCTQVVGQVLPDLSGNGNHGQLGSTEGADTNDPTPTAQGLLFGGDDYAKIPDVPGVKTIYAVVSNAGMVATRYNRLIALNAQITVANDRGQILFSNENNTTSVQSVPTIADGAWTLIAVTYDGAAQASAQIYINGATVAAAITGGGLSFSNSSVIGARTVPEAGAFYGGTIAGILLATDQHSPTQIAQNHAYFRAKFAPLGVVLP